MDMVILHTRLTRLRATLVWPVAVWVVICLILPGRSLSTAAAVTTGVIYTVVGGSNGDGGRATNAVVDARGLAACTRSQSLPADLYIADAEGNRIRKVDGATGVITTVAGTGVAGSAGDGGPALQAQLESPVDVACDANGNLYIADGHRVRKVDPTNRITTVAGNGSPAYSGDNGPATQAGLTSYAVALDASGNIYVADADNRRVRMVDTRGNITTVAGTGVLGYAREGQTASQAALGFPNGVATDTHGRLYINDYNNKVIYRVTNGVINTFAGNYTPRFGGDGGAALQASLLFPNRVAVDTIGNVYISDQGNNRVRRVDTSGIITTVAGNGTVGSTGDGGPGTQASLSPLRAVAVDQLGNVYIASSVNSSDAWSTDNRVRLLNPSGIIKTVVGISSNGDGNLATNAIVDPEGLATGLSAGPQDLYIADSRNNQVRRVDVTTGFITTVAGTGVAGFSGDNGPAVRAQLSGPSAVALDASGNIYIGDQENSRVRRVDMYGTISTVAGNGTFGYSGDGGLAVNARITYPSGLDLDGSGNLLIADRFNHRIRKVTPQGVISTVAGNGTFNPQGAAGDGGQATQAQIGIPTDVVVAPDGSLYLPEFGAHRVRKVRSNGIIITVAGNGNYGSSGDGGLAVNALLNAPFRVALDGQGNLFISDYANNRVRRIDVVSGIITTVAGTGIAGAEGDGGLATLANLYGATGLAVDATGGLYLGQADSARVRVVIQAVSTPRSVVGNIRYYGSNLPVNSATVSLDPLTAGQGGGTASVQTQTDSSGQFTLNSANSGDWQVEPQKLGDIGQAISAIDGVSALNAAVGALPLDAQRLLACDVNGDGKVTAVDALLILQFKVGLISRFPAALYCNSDWAFTPDPATISNQQITAPALTARTCVGGAIGYHPLVGTASNQDFSAVLFGDCSGNWQPSAGRSAAARGNIVREGSPEVRLDRPEQGQRHLRIPLLVQSGQPFQGIDVELQYDSTVVNTPRVRLVGDARRALVAVNTPIAGHLRIALASGQSLKPGRILTLDFEVKNRLPKKAIDRPRDLGPAGVRIVHARVSR